MTPLRIATAVILTALTAAPALAQDSGSRFQVSLYPSGRLITTAGGDDNAQPRFKTYSPGASVTVAFGRYFALEGDVSGSRGSMQSMGALGRKRSPALLAGTVNAVVGLAPGSRVQPYLTVGLGAMRLFQREELGMLAGETLESANAGGGVRVMFDGWGIRADYRFVGMDSTIENRSSFFGPKTRHAHRLAVGVILGSGVR